MNYTGRRRRITAAQLKEVSPPSRLAGKPRKVTDEWAKRFREWKSLAQLAREAGVSRSVASAIRRGYHHKQPSP